MDVQKLLFSKNGLSTRELAKMCIPIQEGERIPTVTAIHEKTDVARGTIQNAIKLLQSSGAITLEARGHLGSFLIKKDMQILLQMAGVNAIVGVMPLPYSKRYEGFATGILTAMKNKYQVPAAMAYMRGAQKRIEMLLSGRYDFAIISQYAARELMNSGVEISAIKFFGKYSYVSKHIIAFRDSDAKEIVDGMRVGIDYQSVDHVKLTARMCGGKHVQYIPMGYHQILEKLEADVIDAAIWNEDEITDKHINMNYQPVPEEDEIDTEAVLVVSAKKPEMSKLLNEIIDVETVKDIQKRVLDGKMTPSY